MFNRLRMWFIRFMTGRYGFDRLGLVLIIAALVLDTVARYVGISSIAGYILALLGTAATVLFILRFLSRNIPARHRENQRFTNFFRGVRGGAQDAAYRAKNAADYKFFTCPNCRSKLRVPRGKGKIEIRCPKCARRFTGKS